MQRLLDRLLSHFSERIVAVSTSVATFTAKQEGIPLSKFIVINNGIDIKAIQTALREHDPVETRREVGFAPADKIVINVSRIVPQKNHRLLFEGFALFAREHPGYLLLVVGGGSHLEEIEAYAKNLGISDKVKFLGYQKEIFHYLGIADFFISTSLIEGFGITHAEALAAGLPVLTTKTAGPDEMIQEGINGFFIPAYTKESVAEGLAKMAAQDLVPMCEAARHSSEAYSIDHIVERYETLFQEVAES